MILLITGDREWKDLSLIQETLKFYPDTTTIIQGGCKGADDLSRIAARRLGIKPITYMADWNTQGLAGGILRNQQMLDEGKPDLVLAFHDDIVNSKGTRDMIIRANISVVEVHLICHEEELKFDRAGGTVLCEICNKTFSRHPNNIRFTWLKQLCDGRLVKL